MVRGSREEKDSLAGRPGCGSSNWSPWQRLHWQRFLEAILAVFTKTIAQLEKVARNNRVEAGFNQR